MSRTFKTVDYDAALDLTVFGKDIQAHAHI